MARHLADDEEFRVPLGELIEHGRQLFAANWTDQEGGGRPLMKGTGKELTDPSRPLTGPRGLQPDLGAGRQFVRRMPQRPVRGRRRRRRLRHQRLRAGAAVRLRHLRARRPAADAKRGGRRQTADPSRHRRQLPRDAGHVRRRLSRDARPRDHDRPARDSRQHGRRRHAAAGLEGHLVRDPDAGAGRHVGHEQGRGPRPAEPAGADADRPPDRSSSGSGTRRATSCRFASSRTRRSTITTASSQPNASAATPIRTATAS